MKHWIAIRMSKLQLYPTLQMNLTNMFIKETRYSKKYIHHYLICIKIKSQLAKWIYSNRSQYTYSSVRHKGASMNFDNVIFHNLNIGDMDVLILKNVPHPESLWFIHFSICMLSLHRLVGLRKMYHVNFWMKVFEQHTEQLSDASFLKVQNHFKCCHFLYWFLIKNQA